MNKNSTIPNTYQAARTLLGDADERKVDNNTLLLPMPDGSIGLKYHRTVIVTYHEDKSVTVNTGGWLTSTTKERMNQALPAGFRIFQKAKTWYVDAPDGETYEYQDGYKCIPESARAFHAYREQL